MNNMHKNMRMYRDFLHSQLKGPILECIKNGLKTEKHRLNILITKRTGMLAVLPAQAPNAFHPLVPIAVITFIMIILAKQFTLSSR